MNEENEPICQKCKQSIDDVWNRFERFEYRTIIGKIKAVYCCLDCQIAMSLEKEIYYKPYYKVND